MKKGLIMEGGAMRGMFTAGVIDVMMEQGIKFDGAVGVSAGAAFGCNYKSKQIGRVIRYNTRFCQDKRYGGFRVLLKEGNFYTIGDKRTRFPRNNSNRINTAQTAFVLFRCLLNQRVSPYRQLFPEEHPSLRYPLRP